MIKIDLSQIERKRLTIYEIDKYCELFNSIKANIENPNFLIEFTKKSILNLLMTGTQIYIYKYNDQIVSSAMMIPCSKESIEYYGLDIDYNEAVDFGPEFVLPEYRGNKLQSYMINDLINLTREQGYKYYLGAVHKDNVYSKNNAIKYGELVNTINHNGNEINIYLAKV